eukprot:g16170.t1
MPHLTFVNLDSALILLSTVGYVTLQFTTDCSDPSQYLEAEATQIQSAEDRGTDCGFKLLVTVADKLGGGGGGPRLYKSVF